MFGIGMMEFLVVAVAVLVFVGPQKMPQLMRQMGRFFVHMCCTATEVRSTFDGVVCDAEAEIRREEFDKIKKVMDDARQSIESPVAAEEYRPDHQHGPESIEHHHDPHHLDQGHDHHDPNSDPDPHANDQPVEPTKTSEN